MRLRTLLLAAALFAPHAAPAQSSALDADAAQPDILERVIAVLDQMVRNDAASGTHTFYFGATYPNHARLTYTASARPLSPMKRIVLEQWIRDYGLPPSTLEHFRQEYLFLEQGRAHWLVLPEQVAESLAERTVGDDLDLFIEWTGARREGEAVEWVFMMSDCPVPPPGERE